jgi:hypothetical protein
MTMNSSRRQGRNPDRDREIVLMREAGMTLREIAEEVGLSRERVRGVIARAWRDEQPLESWSPHDRIYRFAPSARAGHAIYYAVYKTYGEIPDDISPESAARVLARWTRRDLAGHNTGRKTIAELERWLADFGLTFAGEEEPIWWT